MVSFRRFSRGDVLDSESAVAENQRSSERKVRETTEEDPKANVESDELSEVIGVDTEGKPRVNNRIGIRQKDRNTSPAGTWVVEGRAIRVSNGCVRRGRGDKEVVLGNGGTELVKLR